MSYEFIVREKMKSIVKKIIGFIILEGLVLGTCLIFRLMNRIYPRFQKALKNFNATYQFRAGKLARFLVFSEGRIITQMGIVPEPDYELVLIDPLGVLKTLFKSPNDLIKLLMENKIDQSGNNYFLFKLGYLLGLCSRYVQELWEKDRTYSEKKIKEGKSSAIS